jgi:putative tryptophan/tyrosine transport system substrate-binding protein
MGRREFIALVGGAVAAWPLTAFAKAQRIAIVSGFFPVTEMSETSGEPAIRALFNELRRLGYVEGQNLLIERYSGEGRAEHYPDLAREIVRSNPELILVLAGQEFLLDFKAATATIPIVGTLSAGREHHRGHNRCRVGRVVQAGSITAAAGAACEKIWVSRIASGERAVGRP